VEITVRGKHFDVPDSVEQRARRKLAKLEHYLPLLQDAVVEVDIAHGRAKDPKQRYVVRVLVSGAGVHLRAEEHAADVGPAVDEAARAVVDQARKHKERLYKRRSAKGAKDAVEPEISPGAKAEPWERLTRIKHFDLKPITLQDAVSEMEMLGHSFFVYHDADEEQIAVVYLRKGGDYGVILPELS
jgi:putative sigma-54 modulation protein